MNTIGTFEYVVHSRGAGGLILLLHGTGGDEYDLLPLVAGQEERYTIVGLRGNVREHGMNRFFARLAPGVFDTDNIRQEVAKLADSVEELMGEYEVGVEQVTYLGYSNGANMILALATLKPELVRRAVCLHPMLPLQEKMSGLEGAVFVVSIGERDMMIPAAEGEKVVEALTQAGAKVQVVRHEGGHEIRRGEYEAIGELLGFRLD